MGNQHNIHIYGKPEIINSDQGYQFTCALWTEYAENQNITINMDSKDRATDNVFVTVPDSKVHLA
ncbi:MAG TPA: hypothetical protein VKA10_11590 [Prolixibacteraceae bacterium]|nr:hypothetical protein [Prolixibacteraceae bacterium]